MLRRQLTELAMDHQANVDRFSGFADCYDAARPQPPLAAAQILLQYAQRARPAFVVDLGSGTGLSTRLWAGLAERAMGIEPNADMRSRAIAATQAGNITYQEGSSTRTGLPDGCADIVTCSQSLHWMEPQPTFEEVRRILRPGGVFAAIDCDWPPTMTWEVEAAYAEFHTLMSALEVRHGIAAQIRRWDKNGHLDRLRASGCFCFVREVLLHHVEQGNDQRLVELAKSQGGTESLLKLGLTEDQIGLSRLRARAGELIGSQMRPWYFSYRVRIGVKC